MFYTYIIYSSSIDKYYIGYTNNLTLRLERHNSSWGKFSSKGVPWQLVYNEEFNTKSEAIKRENQIKKKKSRKFIEDLICHAEGRPDTK